MGGAVGGWGVCTKYMDISLEQAKEFIVLVTSFT